MDNETMSEYWKDVSPILKEQASEKRKNCFDDRLEYAKKQFFEKNIPFKLCNTDNGHFNLLNSNGKVLMSFWSYTGKAYVPSTGFSENIGIKNCIKMYKKLEAQNAKKC